MASKKNKKQKGPYNKYTSILWGLFVLSIIGVMTLFGGAALGFYGPMPDLQQLENPRTNLASQIISSDGEILGKYYFDENRTPIGFDEIPTNMVEALIATEDERFYDHSGIDWLGTLRAFAFLGKRGGASTISQQLARQIFVGVRSRSLIKTILQKAQEYVIAVQLEQRYTKKEILSMTNLCIRNLEEINFFKPKEKKPIMLENLRNIFYRMELSAKETRILSSVFASLGKKR